MKVDKLLYLFFLQNPEGFFQLLGRSGLDAARFRFESIEVKELAFRFDAIFSPIFNDDFTYFTEVQFQSEFDFYSRFFSEIFMYLR
jgi:predicted transposase YdaD